MKKILILLIATTWIYSADHYVLPAATGSGNGSDWNNAYGGLPSALTRGDTYWVDKKIREFCKQWLIWLNYVNMFKNIKTNKQSDLK